MRPLVIRDPPARASGYVPRARLRTPAVPTTRPSGSHSRPQPPMPSSSRPDAPVVVRTEPISATATRVVYRLPLASHPPPRAGPSVVQPRPASPAHPSSQSPNVTPAGPVARQVNAANLVAVGVTRSPVALPSVARAPTVKWSEGDVDEGPEEYLIERLMEEHELYQKVNGWRRQVGK
jgi:hypothetical protein